MSENHYKTIGEIVKKLNLTEKKTGHLQAHTLRYWETQFKQIKPKIMAGRRRYYSNDDFEIIRTIKYLLKEQGLTIKGVKRILDNSKTGTIDVDASLGIYNQSFKKLKTIKKKARNISKIIKELKEFE